MRRKKACFIWHKRPEDNKQLTLGLLLVPDIEGEDGCYDENNDTYRCDNFHITSPCLAA